MKASGRTSETGVARLNLLPPFIGSFIFSSPSFLSGPLGDSLGLSLNLLGSDILLVDADRITTGSPHPRLWL
jgi:hypothetical protein